MNKIACHLQINLLSMVICSAIISCKPAVHDSPPQPAICMSDRAQIFKNPGVDGGVVTPLDLGARLFVYADSASFAVHDTTYLFKRIRLASDTTREGWVRADYLAVNCQYGAVTGRHAEIYANDLAPLDTISYMSFVAEKPAHISGYKRIYKMHASTGRMITGLIPDARITSDTASAAFALLYEKKARTKKGRSELFAAADWSWRQTDFFKRSYRAELDSERTHGISQEVMASHLLRQFRNDTSRLLVRSVLLDRDGNLTDSLVTNVYKYRPINFRTWAIGKGKIRILVSGIEAYPIGIARQDSVFVNGIAVHFVDAMQCRRRTVVSVFQDGKESFKRTIDFGAGR